MSWVNSVLRQFLANGPISLVNVGTVGKIWLVVVSPVYVKRQPIKKDQMLAEEDELVGFSLVMSS